MNGSWNEKFFHVEMALGTERALDQLNHLIDTTFPDVEKIESSNRRSYTLESLYTALDHQLQDGLMAQHEIDRMGYIVQKLFDLKLQIHAIEAEPSLRLPVDVIGHTVALMLDLHSEGIITRSLFVYVCYPPYLFTEKNNRWGSTCLLFHCSTNPSIVLC